MQTSLGSNIWISYRRKGAWVNFYEVFSNQNEDDFMRKINSPSEII